MASRRATVRGASPRPGGRRLNANARRIVGALTLTKAGDRAVDAKTVLAWLLAALEAPAITTGLLVPVREAGALLPQAALVPWVRRFRHRSWVWMIGAAGQAVAVGLIAVVAGLAEGAVAGWGVVAALGLFALARSLSSIAVKDVIGRTVAKGSRGVVTGWSDTMSGLVAVTLGLAIRILGGDAAARAPLVALVAVASAAWVLALLVFATVDEPAEEPEAEPVGAGGDVGTLRMLRTDAAFRRFVLARTLLLVSALSPPFVVALAVERTGAGVAGLGPFVVASGAASLVGGRLWGGAADRSSRLVMVAASGAAAAVVVVFLAGLPAVGDAAWWYVAAYLSLALVHTGARVGRSTYVVDLAAGDRRTAYVAGSNTAMGVLLLVVGTATGALSSLGPQVALGVLAAIGLAGVPVGLSLPEVSAGGA